MAGKPIGITLLGCGVVGGGVVRILHDQAELLQQRAGVGFDIRHVVVRETNERADRAGLPLTTDAKAAIDDPETKIVVELIGGTTLAGDLVERALKLSKPVVTANKSLLAARGPELFALARKHKTCIAFEASCGGGIPIIHALTHSLLANRIDALVGIVNGTCNVILTRMTKSQWTYAQALQEAQRSGFAEADPALDVSGRDSAQKLALLAGIAFNVNISEADIHIEGIDTIQPADIQFAEELGYVVKLLAIAERSGIGSRGSGVGEMQNAKSSDPKPDTRNSTPDALCLRVHPTLIHKNDLLAEVNGSFNAISVYGHALGHALFYGRGAGQMPTASAVVADLIGVAMGTTLQAFNQLRIFPDTTPPAKLLPLDDLTSRFYLRLMASDAPGVLAAMTDVLSRHHISLSAVLQRETDDGDSVPVVITTHAARESAMRAALKEIDQLKTISPPSVCLRIIDQPKEFAGK